MDASDHALLRQLGKPQLGSILTDRQIDTFCAMFGITERDVHTLRIFAAEGNVYLIHMISDTPTNAPVRGIVLEKTGETFRIVAPNFPVTKEVEADADLDEFPLEHSTATIAPEGILLRVYFADGKWFFSTCRSLSAFDSNWSGTTPKFGDMFHEVWGDAEFEGTLSRDLCYFFILSHPKARVINFLTEPRLYLTAIAEDGYLRRATERDLEGLPGKVELTRTAPVETVGELRAFVSGMFWKDTTGVLLTVYPRLPDGGEGIYPSRKVRAIKLCPPTYLLMREVRGNEPSLRFRYYQLRQTPRPEDKEKVIGVPNTTVLTDLYPEKKKVFEEAEALIDKTVDKLCVLSTRRRRGEIIELPHDVHCCVSDRRSGNLPRHIIDHRFKALPAQKLNFVIRYFLQLEKRAAAGAAAE